MTIVKRGVAGTMDSSDVQVTISPPDGSGIRIDLQSVVIRQFGDRIREVVLETLDQLGVTDASVDLQDKGALDCTLRARIEAAAHRAAGLTAYQWRRDG